MSLQLIDDHGQEWSGGSRKLREAFDSPYSGGEFVDYAVTNLGFVAIHGYGSSCQVRLRPSLITDVCWRAVRRWLSGASAERVVVTWFESEWAYELIRNGDSAVRRIEGLIATAGSARPADFLSRSIPVDELHPTSPLGEIVRNWPEYAVPSGQQALMQLLQATLGSRYIVVKRSETRDKIVFKEVGAGLFSEYETWRNCAIGAPMEEMPDRAYGRWAARCYDNALQTNQPQIDDVDAIVRWPHAGRMRLRYKRVIVPINTATDSPMLLGGSFIDGTIDLRMGGG